MMYQSRIVVEVPFFFLSSLKIIRKMLNNNKQRMARIKKTAVRFPELLLLLFLSLGSVGRAVHNQADRLRIMICIDIL